MTQQWSLAKQDCLLKNVSALSGSTGTQCLLLYCEYHYCNMNIINNILIISFPEICMYSRYNYYLYISCMNVCIIHYKDSQYKVRYFDIICNEVQEQRCLLIRGGGRTRSRVPQICWVITISPIQFVGRFGALL